MKTAMKRVASLLLALIMILEVVAPGVVEARSAGQNRATVSDEEFIPPDGNRIDPDQNAGSHLPNFIDPDDDGYYTPPQKAPARPAQNAPAQAAPKQGVEANDVEVSEEKAPTNEPVQKATPGKATEGARYNENFTLEFNEAKERERVAATEGISQLSSKKFRVLTRFDTSTVAGPIKAGQYFTIYLDGKLKVNEPEKLVPIEYNGKAITDVSYDEKTNSIKYTIKNDITENIKIPLDIEVDYNVDKIDTKAKQFTVVNRVSGLGVTRPTALLPVVVDMNGNMTNTITESAPDRPKQIIDQEPGDPYKVDVDFVGNPVIKDSELQGYNWKVMIRSNTDLATLGLKTNITVVKGSGLGELDKIKVNGKDNDLVNNPIKTDDPSTTGLGIVDSKHHDITESSYEAYYTFYTPVTAKQSSYAMDLSLFLKDKSKKGAVRLIVDDAFKQDKIMTETPNRVGMNSRTTILGEFTSESTATWTVTDAVSSKDPGNLPLAKRELDNQTMQENGAQVAVYGLDNDGKMVATQVATPIAENTPPAAGTNPANAQPVGTIAVYEYKTQLNKPEEAMTYGLAGVTISKYEDLVIDQAWGLPQGKTMPAQTIQVKDGDNVTLGSKYVSGSDSDTERERVIVIPSVRFWSIANDGKATRNNYRIEQNLDQIPITPEADGTTYKYYENVSYYKTDLKVHYIHNTLTKSKDLHPATFALLKVDSKDNQKRLPGAKLNLFSPTEESFDVETDQNGRVEFSNVKPGVYKLIEKKAPKGYKVDQSLKTVTVSDQGQVSVSGDNMTIQGGLNPTKMVEDPRYPDYMNAMHYGTIDENKQVEYYVYLKAKDKVSGTTDRDTRLNLGIDRGSISSVEVYDVNPTDRRSIRQAMDRQTVDQAITQLTQITNSPNNKPITITSGKTDDFTGKTGYQVCFPSERFGDDWGFLVRVKGSVDQLEGSNAYYDWLTDVDTEGQAKLQESVPLSAKGNNGNKNAVITLTNEGFVERNVQITKVNDKKEQEPLEDATLVLKNSDGDIIATKTTGKDGLADFGPLEEGHYTIEERRAPNGYQDTPVIFDVTVDDSSTVTYKARFRDGNGSPIHGQDYWLENEEDSQAPKTFKVTEAKQSMDLQEDGPWRNGTKPKVWEAYRLESYKYTGDFVFNGVKPGTKFVIQFDPNLDFVKYVSEFPKIMVKDIGTVAEPYFDYETNRLTYVFNEKVLENVAANIEIVGIIPDGYFAQHTNTDPGYDFETKIIPEAENNGKNVNVLKTNIKADYGAYDTGFDSPAISNYIRDFYTGPDGETYMTVLAYYNALTNGPTGGRVLKFDWMSATRTAPEGMSNYTAKGLPAFDLQNVEIYSVYPSYQNKKLTNAMHMPLSYGLKPERDPGTYTRVYEKKIDPSKKVTDSSGSFQLTYDPNRLKSWGTVNREEHPLEIRMPAIKNKEGYVIVNTYKVNDPKRFEDLWKVTYMKSGTLESAAYQRVNYNKATAGQSGQELPKFYSQKAKLVNRPYTPGEFSILKVEEGNETKKLQGALFSLTDQGDKDGKNKKTIYRASDINGIVNFTDLRPGSYILKEEESPKDHVNGNKTWQVNVNSDGYVTIVEIGLNSQGSSVGGKKLKLKVTNKPEVPGAELKVYKKDSDGIPLEGAVFKLKNHTGTPDYSQTAATGDNGIVTFKNIKEGTYILEEVKPPVGYKELKKKWVVVADKTGGVKFYNYVEGPSEGTDPNVNASLLKGSDRVDVAHRSLEGWNMYDNRWGGYVDNRRDPYIMGTRIIAIHKNPNYVIQRYIINPEGNDVTITDARIHREKPSYDNMNWYNGDEEIKVYTLDKPVNDYVEAVQFNNYRVEDITTTITKTPFDAGGQNRVMLTGFPSGTKPIVVDVKVPYDSDTGGVGTGMDLNIKGDNTTYWKSDYYEKASLIKTSGPVETTGEAGNIKGGYISDDSLDVTNTLEKHDFKIKKINGETLDAVSGATFKLTGPNGSQTTSYERSDKDGIIHFKDLVPGDYILEEDAPAQGYEKIPDKWTVKILHSGKVFIKNNDASTKMPEVEGGTTPTLRHLTDKTAMLKVMDRRLTGEEPSNFLTTFAANSGLELGDENVPSPVRDDGWEKVDINASTGRGEIAHSTTLIETKITEINKTTHRFKQVFLYKPARKNKGRQLQFHRQPENGEFNLKEGLTDVSSIRIYRVGEGSTLDQIVGTPKEITRDCKLGPIEISGKPKRVKADISATNNSVLLVEIETKYDPTKALGIGSDYNFDTSQTAGNKDWAGDSYASETGINANQPKITYETGWEFAREIEKPETINIPEADKYEDETWTIPGNKGKLYREYKYTLQDGVRTGEKVATGNTKEDPSAKADEYHYGTKKRPTPPREDKFQRTETIPYETVVETDNSLPAGASVVDQKGKPGSVQREYTISYEVAEGANAEIPNWWPKDIVASPKSGERVLSYNRTEVAGTRVEPTTEKVRKGPKDPETPEGFIQIPADGFAKIPNKRVGLIPKIFKKDTQNKPLPGAEFSLKKMTDNTYKTEDTKFNKITAISREDGSVVFKDGENPVYLQEGFYLVEETKAPPGYKKAVAPWKIEIGDKDGHMYAFYNGPEETPANFITSEYAKGKNDTTNTNDAIKYASAITYIDPNATTTHLDANEKGPTARVGTFTQRIYIDTRGYKSTDKLNVQIVPVKKREETDIPNKSPYTTTQGVKTAYRTTYKVAVDPGDKPDVDSILKSYDLSKDNVSIVNTARWRPFGWGFEEDQLNLEPGSIYFIDVEGYYDEDIVKDPGKIEMMVKLYKGERKFQQAKERNDNGEIIYENGGSYQQGNLNLGYTDLVVSDTGQLGKTGGRIYPELPSSSYKTITTSFNIKPLYESKEGSNIPKTGVVIHNAPETYNVTFTKNGRDKAKWKDESDDLAKRRLEGAVFKLQRQVGDNFEDVEGSYISSAFNGFFGFRGLKAGRYRLMEVKAPQGYKPIKDAVLTFSIVTLDKDKEIYDKNKDKLVKIIPAGSGEITLEYGTGNSIIAYDPDKTEGKLIDYVTAATAKNMGKVINEKPGKGKVTVKKVDEEGKALSGAGFRLTRLSGESGTPTTKYVPVITTEMEDKDKGTLVFDDLNLGNYRLEEIKPAKDHVNRGQVWNFTVGGEGMDPYAGPVERNGKDITASISIDKANSSMTVIRPQGDKPTAQGDKVIYPHKGEAMDFKTTFKLAEGTKINPGDYFTVKLSDWMDLNGIYQGNVAGLDIFADGVGTIAKADYDKEKGTITYTFTDYADTYTLDKAFKTTISAFIRLDKAYTNFNNVPVGVAMNPVGVAVNNEDYGTINVHYDLEPGYGSGYGSTLNISSKIVQYNIDNGEFVQYFYVNRDRLSAGPFRFDYRPNKDVSNLVMSVFDVQDPQGETDYMERHMPLSYAVNEQSPDTPPISSQNYGYLPANNARTINFNYGANYYQGYIIKVSGKVEGKDKSSFNPAGQLTLNYDRNIWAEARSGVHFQENSTAAEAKLLITAINPSNEIAFKKVGEDGSALSGAEFALEKKTGGKWSFSSGYTDTTDETGILRYNRLEPGEYRFREVKAPDGYVTLPVADAIKFTVEESGKITRKETQGGKEVIIEETGTPPIPVINHKPIVFTKMEKSTTTTLANAEFVLYHKENQNDQYKPYQFSGNANGKTITSDANGKITLELSKPGYYALEEKTAPKGYIKPSGYVKEFVIRDSGYTVKEKGLNGNIKKQEGTTDRETSMMLIEQNEKANALTAYLVINPEHKPRTYGKDDLVLINYDNVKKDGENSIIGYKIDDKGKEMPIQGLKVGRTVGDDPYVKLYSVVGGKDSEISTTSTDTIILKMVGSVQDIEKPIAIETEITEGSGLKRAVYNFTYSDLDKFAKGSVNPTGTTPPARKEGQDDESYQKELDAYLKNYLKDYRDQDVYIKLSGNSESKELERIDNTKGVYPFTGGFGPHRWIVIIGAVIAAVAAEEYIRRKRSSAPKGGA